MIRWGSWNSLQKKWDSFNERFADSWLRLVEYPDKWLSDAEKLYGKGLGEAGRKLKELAAKAAENPGYATGEGFYAFMTIVTGNTLSKFLPGKFVNCFPADTPVATEHGPRPIQDVRAADRVWAFDLVTGEWKLRHVIEAYRHEHDGDVVAATVAGEVIESTGHHPWWVVRVRA